MSQPAGWFPDPYGRYQLRYYNGDVWTEHVATGGEQLVDPLGSSSVIPIAIPPTAIPPAGQAFAATTTSSGSGVNGFLDGLGVDARMRPAPHLSLALAGIGGGVAAAAITVLVGRDEFGRGRLIAAALVVLAIAYAIRFLVRAQRELRAAAVGAAVVGIPLLGGAATVPDSGDAGFLTGLVIAALYVAAWALPGLRGRSVMLGLGALVLVVAFASLFESDDPNSFVPPEFGDVLGNQGAAYLIGGAILLAAVWWLDRQGYFGVGTALVVAGLAASIIGALLLAGEFGDVGGPLLVTLVGVIVCLVGTNGGRRATTWWGAALAGGGTVAVVLTGIEPDSLSGIGTSLLLAALLLIGVPALVRVIRDRRDDDTAPSAPSTPFAPPT